ncbi:MAG: hypothetical protein ACLFT0_01775 [Spirulinaceae cyanobacterium]
MHRYSLYQKGDRFGKGARVICHWLLVIGYWLLVVGCWLLVIGHLYHHSLAPTSAPNPLRSRNLATLPPKPKFARKTGFRYGSVEYR